MALGVRKRPEVSDSEREGQAGEEPSREWPRPEPVRPERGVTLRCILVGLALIPFNSYWVGLTEGVWHGLHFTCLSLAMNVVFLLLLVRGVTQLLARRWPAARFSQAELLTLFSMLALASVLAGHDRLVTLMGTVAHARRFATPENRWEQLFFPQLPWWLTVQDKEAAFHYYAGGSSYWSTGYWRHWVIPGLAWTGFVATLVGSLACLTVIMRKRWTEAERLSYPILQIPLAVTEPSGAFWRSRVLWAGILLAAGLEVLAGLNRLYPSIPALTYAGESLEIGPLITEKPWNAIGSLRLDWYPCFIGLAFLLPTDLIFSTWFFYLVSKAQLVFGSALAIPEAHPRYPWFGMQAAGAVLAAGCAALWEARWYLRGVFRRAAGLRTPATDAGEALSYRAACVGLGAGLLLLGWFAHACGMALWMIPLYWALFFLIALTVARLRADTGAPAHGLIMATPHDVIVNFAGTPRADTGSVVALNLFMWFNRFNRAHPMPVQLETLKLASVARVEQRRMLGAVAIAAVVTMALGFVIYPALMYRHGAALAEELNWTGWAVYNQMGGWMVAPQQPDYYGQATMGTAAAFTLLLAFLRSRFIAFPFHPFGYALGISGSVDRWWLALVLCTIIKGLITRYLGVRGYRAALPFFMGLVIGQYVVACLWSLLAIAIEQPTYWSWRG